MEQYDLLLTQNIHASQVDYYEKFVNVAKGDLLSADVEQTPTVLPAGTDGYVLQRDDVEITGLKWVEPGSLGVAVANQGNDRVVTSTAEADALNAEAGLTYNTTQGLYIGSGLGIVFPSAATSYQIYTADGAFTANIDIFTGTNSSGGAGDVTIKGGAGTAAGGNVYFQRDVTYGNFYFGTGGTGHLPARSSETDVVYYDSNTGQLSYGASYWTAATNGINYAGGNVGIGTNSPDAQLEIYHSGSTTGITTGLKVAHAANATDYVFQFAGSSDYATNQMVMLQTGRIGIGVTIPILKVDIGGEAGDLGPPASSGTDPDGILRVGYKLRTWSGGEINFGVLNTDDYPTWIQAQQPTDHSIQRVLALQPIGGYVGIGTYTPTYKLDVNGTGRFTGDLTGDSDILAAGDIIAYSA